MSAPSNTRRYEYRSLDSPRSFRLLKLTRGAKSDPLECELSVHKLQDLPCGVHSNVPEFQALSYVWGSDPPIHEIRCDDGHFRITETLRRALCRLRRQDRHIFVWADAICINQSDLKERRQQVALMRIIFSRAKMVTACLDLNETLSVESQRALARELQRMGSEACPVRSSRTPKLALFAQTQNTNPTTAMEMAVAEAPRSSRRLLQNITANDFPPQFATVFAAFFDNPWFSRVWVVQEVFESRKCRVLFGEEEEVPWLKVIALARWLMQSRDKDSLGAQVLRLTKTNGVQNALFMHSGSTIWAPDPIPGLLQSVRDFGCTDPRDKVYAVLHMPFRQALVYRRMSFLASSKYLHFFVQGTAMMCILIQLCRQDPTDLLFWTLLLSVSYLTHHMVILARTVAWDFFQRLLNFLYTVDRVVLHDYKYSDTLQNALSLTADYSLPAQTLYRMVAVRMVERTKRLDMLSYVNHGKEVDINYPSWVPRWDVSADGLQPLTSLHQFRASANIPHELKRSSRPDHLVVAGLRFSTVSWTTPVLDATAPTSIPNHTVHRPQPPLTLGRKHPRTRQVSVAGHIRASQSTELALISYAQSRRRFGTESGMQGIGPQAMKPGDVVCVLFGGPVPYILRKTDTDNVYRVVGECYLRGIMLGRPIDMWREGLLAKEWFTLC